ncbi:MAG: hypothetical protein KAX46_07790, partial [Chromatiaceae bacterium]|nr:hypothetical protein [Chromatiaceae bacterium]
MRGSPPAGYPGAAAGCDAGPPPASWAGERVVRRRRGQWDDIDSTNADLLRAGHVGAPSGTLCLAERQSAGRGRRGRAWVSPFGANLYLSLLWRFPGGPGE